jgi:toxin-antitoxin system PIN domain toxin
MRLFCPDINVWIALSYEGHEHHRAAAEWFASVDGDVAYFCRLTQLGFLRLLTHPSVMRRDVRSQAEAWQTYDLLQTDQRVSFQEEADAAQVESVLRRLTTTGRASSKQWPDAYLAAFARTVGLTLVTFDHGLHNLSRNSSVLLS